MAKLRHKRVLPGSRPLRFQKFMSKSKRVCAGENTSSPSEDFSREEKDR
jgi:hypothetical protein